MKKVYPAIFTPDGGWILVSIPDFDIMTQGENLADAIDMARDAISLMGIHLEDEHKPLPVPTDILSLSLEKGQISTLIDCDFEAYRKTLHSENVFHQKNI